MPSHWWLRPKTLGWLLLLWALSAVSTLAPAQATPGPGPTEVVQRLYGELLDTMQHAAALGARGRYQKLEPLILKTYDVPFMARLTIGPIWAGLAPDKKREAARAYGRYITAVYASQFDGYAGEKLEVLGEQKIKRGVLVKSRIVKSDGQPVTLNYMVHDNENGWQVRDVYETGTISQLATQRSDFSQLLRTGGIDALIAALNKKADDLQS
ncbi:MAG TPA: ABC transporter substrate-binding protein [Stellaceae bacterium]|nr:ABC transporter substrate-binding protein [Stellaceae bacterium]